MESLDRLIVSPASGVFEPIAELVGIDGAPLEIGQVVGALKQGAIRTEVRAYAPGVMRGFLAWDGERVQEYQPLVWMQAS